VESQQVADRASIMILLVFYVIYHVVGLRLLSFDGVG
jgi:hypothetical protein